MPLVTWYSGPPAYRVTPSTNEENDILDALNSLIVANSASSSAYWEVVQYVSTSPRSLLLRRKNNAAGRIVIFGQNGSTPNAAAVRGTPTGSLHYIGYSPSSTTNAVNSYLTGAPLPDSDYMPGLNCWAITVSTEYLLSYAEHADGIVLMATTANSSVSFCGAGELIESASGTTYSSLLGIGFPGAPAADSSYASGQSAIVARVSSSNKLIFRIFTAAMPTGQMHDLASHRAQYFPIWLCYNTTDSAGVLGKLRQICYGPPTNRWTGRIGGGSPPNQVDAYALGHQHFDLTTGTPVWFTNFGV